jgi:hypothetical protein
LRRSLAEFLWRSARRFTRRREAVAGRRGGATLRTLSPVNMLRLAELLLTLDDPPCFTDTPHRCRRRSAQLPKVFSGGAANRHRLVWPSAPPSTTDRSAAATSGWRGRAEFPLLLPTDPRRSSPCPPFYPYPDHLLPPLQISRLQRVIPPPNTAYCARI